MATSTTPSVTLSPPPSSPSLSVSSDSSTLTTSSTASMSSPPLSPEKSPSSSVSSAINSTATVATTASQSTAPASASAPSTSTHPRATEAPPKQRSKNGYIGRVGFDTLGCNTPTEYTFTLQARTDRWHRTRRSRTFLIGMDLNEHSAHALQWAMENMVEDGDEVIALRVVPMELRDSFAKTGIPSFQGQEVAARTEAISIMNMIREKNQSKQINIVVEIVVGNIRDTIQHMIKMYEPQMLVVGTRGKNTMRGFLLGSVSRYCLNHSPVPVTVVRPASKLIKSKTKAKGIFRRRTSIFSESETEPEPPQVFFSSPLSRQTSRTSVDYSAAGMGGVGSGGIDPESGGKSAGAITGSATSSARPSLFLNSAPLSGSLSPKGPGGPYSSLPASPSGPGSISSQQLASINSSLSYASALLSDSPSDRIPPPPDGRLRLKKSLTTDGSSPSSSSKLKSRKSFGKLSGAMLLGPLSMGSKEKSKKKAAAAAGAAEKSANSGFLSS
ncbi:hypothetical protein EMPS_00366 [Entomortierella parvispora]|uniref:UspA domain-containing protein n=1 Tax=Entomortierella parvispora TaxID=205924 RepID=A0A9P3LRW9_9FUNG|nr:hypothetical protein EMPS_00366 [Entomortierella parvispora]